MDMKKRKKYKKYLVLLLVMTLAFTGLIAIKRMGTVHAGVAYKDANITVTVSDLYVNGKKAADGMTVKDGDTLNFELNWELSNLVKDQFTFECDLTSVLHNMVANMEEKQFIDWRTGYVMGSYKIENNKLIITVTKEYIELTSERSGQFQAEGKVQANRSDVKDGDEIELGFTGETVDVIWSNGEQPGKANMSKSVNLSKDKNGRLLATYTITISGPWDSAGKATNLQLKDVPGSGLGNMSGITVTDGSWMLPDGKTNYASLAEFNRALANVELSANQSMTLTYTMEVKSEAELSGGSKPDNYKNTATLTYNKKQDTPANPVTKEAQITYKGPSINKVGTVSEDNKTVQWSVTVDVGSVYEEGKSLSDYFASVKDMPGEGHLSQQAKNLPLNKFTDHRNGTFTYTYEEELSAEYRDSIVPKEVTNRVEMTSKANSADKWSDSGEAWTHEKAWVNKEFVSYDETGRKLNWKITVDVPKDATGLSIRDAVQTWRSGSHTLTGNFSVEGIGEVINSGRVTNSTVVKSYQTPDTIIFQDAWVKAHRGKQVVILCDTLVTDSDVSGKEYENLVNASYTPETGGSVSCPQRSAMWKKKDIVDKDGTVVAGENSIDYTVRIALDELEELEKGKTFQIKDTLPEEFEVNPSAVSVAVCDQWGNSPWDMPKDLGTAAVSGRELTVSIPVSESFLGAVDYIKGYNGEIYIKVTYRATMKKSEAVEFTKKGTTRSFVNQVEGKYGGEDIGTDSTTTSLTPKNVISKSAVYSKETAPYIYYTIRVNPDGLDFSDGVLTAVDTLGPESVLYYDIESIKVTKADGTQLSTSSWKWAYDETKRSLTFTLPDSMPLTITYRVLVDTFVPGNTAEKVELTTENSKNTFALSGAANDKMQDSESFNQVAITPDGWGQAETGSITLSKYHSEKSNQNLLPGAKFSIYEATYDTAKKEMKRGSLFKDNIQIGENGQYTVMGLRYDQIYVLVETEAPEGYKKNEEPYYFVLTGYSGIKLPAGMDINEISSLGGLWYENKPDEEKSGTLTITKSFNGLADADAKNLEKVGNITFQVTDTGKSGTVKNYSLKNFKHDGAGNYTLTLPSPIGMYTVKETVTDIDGYEIVTTEYQIDSAGKKTGNTAAEIEVPKGTDKKITFTNTYKKTIEMGELVITKTIKGDVTREEAEGALRFTVTDTGTNETNSYTLKQFDYNPLTKQWTLKLKKPVDTYTVTETQKNIKGYEMKSVQYSINAQGQREGSAVTVSVPKNGTVSVDFEDTYEKIIEYGKLIITKTIGAGIASLDVVNHIVFEVTNQETGVKNEYTLSDDFIFNKDGTKWTKVLEKQLQVGNYTVVERAEDINGYELASTTYTISAEDVEKGTGSGETASTSIAKDETVTVDYKNTYNKIEKDETAKLRITKTITGPVTREEAEGALVFTIKDKETGLVRTIPLNEFKYDAVQKLYSYDLERKKGKEYEITETVKDIEGYILASQTYTIDAGTEKAEKTAVVTLGAFGNTVAFKDDYKKKPQGELQITKTIEGAVTPEELAGALKFRVTDTGTNISTEYTIGDGRSGFTYDAETDAYILKLTKAVGTYRVEEILTDVDGYQFVGASYTVDAGGKKEGKVVSAEVKDGKTTTVNITNAYEKITKTGVLAITKTIEGPVTPEEAKGALKFAVTDTATGNTTEYTLEDFTRDPKTGIYTMTLPAKPEGSYLVQETVSTVGGYQRKSVEYSVNGKAYTPGMSVTAAVEGDKTTTVDFKDAYETSTESGTLVITKTIEGKVTKEEAEGALKFKVTDKRTGLFNTYTLRDFTYDEKTGIYTKTLENQAVGAYVVEETLYDVNGYRLISRTYAVNGNVRAGEAAEAEVENQETTTVSIRDVYDKTKTGTLLITKTIKGPVTKEEAAGALQFKVTDGGTGVSTTYALHQFNYDTGADKYTLSLPKPIGTYTVEETVTDINGYQTASVKYAIDGGEKTDGKAVTAVITADKMTTVAYEDKYTKKETESDEDTDTGKKSRKTKKDEDKTVTGNPKTGDPRKLLGILCIFVAIFSAIGVVALNLPKNRTRRK